MKIFNWIHRHRFSNYNAHSSEVPLVEDGSSVRRSEASFRKANIEKEPLLEEDVKAVEGWELDGILAIGTLAIEPLETINLMQDEEGDNGEIEQSYNDNDHHHDSYENDTMLLKDDAPKCDIEMCKLNSGKRCSNEIEVVEEEIMYEKLTNMVKRVTLLDLFLADEVAEKVPEKANGNDSGEDGDETKVIETKKKKKMHILYRKLPAAMGGKKGVSPKSNDDDARPLKKLHRFMTRMMKRKIHPDMEARLQKKEQLQLEGRLNDDVSMGIDGHDDSTNDQYAAYESVSLLPPQGIMV